MVIQWSKDLEIGVPFVDADHRVLINLLNQVDTCVEEREESMVLGSILNALTHYTEYHFTREEKLMELADYDGVDAHKEVHQQLFHKVRAIFHSFAADPESVAAEDVRDFLSNWLSDHILVQDAGYRDACIDNLAASEAAETIPFIQGNGDQIPFKDLSLLRILLVDDNPNFCRLVRTLLKAVGIENVEVRELPSDGLDYLIRRPADVVLCDWMMDEMTGVKFAEKVRELELPSKIVMMSGLSIKTVKDNSRHVEINDYLEKPIDPQLLLETISRVAFSSTQQANAV